MGPAPPPPGWGGRRSADQKKCKKMTTRW
jgi:hypothetical protein